VIPPTAALASVDTGEDRPMRFLEHLDVLRATLVRAAIVALTLVAASWFFSDRLLEALIQTLAPGQRVLALAPAEAFSARINVALWTGGLLAVPYVMLEVWIFVAPGLKRDERHFAVPWMIVSAILLYAGLAFALQVLLPIIVGMLASFATPHVEARVGLAALVSFAVQLGAGCAILFQLPLVLCLLVWFRLVTPYVLARAWRHAVFFIALGAAIVTPGDGPSMLVLAAPLVLLYFVSVLVSWIIWKVRGPKGGSDAPRD
jgi:sec-independent protein translocase protein TatC